MFGPPLVMMKAWAKTWNDWITPMIRLKSRTGVISGSVIDQNERQVVAPSTRAAS